MASHFVNLTTMPQRKSTKMQLYLTTCRSKCCLKMFYGVGALRSTYLRGEFISERKHALNKY